MAEEKKSGIGSLLGGVAGAVKGAGQNIATLLGRAGKAAAPKLSDFDIRLKVVELFSEGKIPTRNMFSSDEEYNKALKDFELITYLQTDEGKKDQANKRLLKFIADVETARERPMAASRIFEGFKSSPQDIIKKLTEDDNYVKSRLRELMIDAGQLKEFGPKAGIRNLPPRSMMMDTTTGEGANIFRIKEADGGRIGYQTGGITMANTLAENIRRNLANQRSVQAQFDAARQKLKDKTQRLTSSFNPETRSQARSELFGQGYGVVERPFSPPGPSADYTPPPLPKLSQDFINQLESLRGKQKAAGMSGQDLIPDFTEAGMIDLGGIPGLLPNMEREQEKLDFLTKGVDQGLSFDQISQNFADQQVQKMLANEKKFGSFSDGREVNPSLGKSIYQNILKEMKMSYPAEFAKLTGDETLAELDQKLFDLGGGGSAFAVGGRVGYQTGGVTEQRTLPPEFVEAAQKTFLTDLSRQAGIPTITTAVQQQPGETAQQFANRQAQAQQFQITKAGMAELAPQVAAQDPLQAAAYAQAVDPTKGLGAFQPFLTKAGTAADAAAGLTGPMTAAQQTAYTSPFQQQVIDTTLAEFDKQAKMRENQLAASALGVPGAFGGGREGVQRAEFQATSDANRARVLADLRQRGFQQAATARQQDLANQMGIAQLQSGLGGAAQDFARAQISGLGTLGAGQQAQTQAVLDAQRQAAAMAVEDPRRRLSMFGQGISGLTPGAGTVQLMPTETGGAAGPSPLMQALGVGLAGADIYGRIFGGKRQCQEY